MTNNEYQLVPQSIHWRGPNGSEIMLCVTCGRDRRGHDHANRIVLPEHRHDWETPQTRAARQARTKDQSALFESEQQ